MKLVNKDKDVNLIIDDDLLKHIAQLGIEKFPNECGGFLIGHYSDDSKSLYIKDILLPKKQKGLLYLYERSIDGMKQLFNALFEQKKYYYVGEWHTHPNGSSMYSQTDLNAMIEIENCETVNITNPVLLILSIQDRKLKDFSFYIYNNKGLYRYE